MAMIRKGRFERSADAISEDRRSSLPLFSIPPHKGDQIQFIPVLPSSAIVFATEPIKMLSSQVWGWSEEGVEDKHVEALNLNLSDRRLRLALDLARQLMGARAILANTPAASS